MTDQEARYDRIAEGYATWWSPVHRQASLDLLDEVDPAVRAGATRLLDIGCGAGALGVVAARRWPSLEVDGIDASTGMLAIAARERARLPVEVAARLRLHHAQADRLPFPDGTFDVALAAFVLQLVPSSYRALREARRVLRPGGRLAHVTWLGGGPPLGADAAYEAVLADLGLEPLEHGGPADLPTVEVAAARLRRAGFTDVTAHSGRLVHAFTPEGYLGFLAGFDDEDRFAQLVPDVRARLERELLSRLRDLPGDALRLEAPVVYATGRRTGRS